MRRAATAPRLPSAAALTSSFARETSPLSASSSSASSGVAPHPSRHRHRPPSAPFDRATVASDPFADVRFDHDLRHHEQRRHPSDPRQDQDTSALDGSGLWQSLRGRTFSRSALRMPADKEPRGRGRGFRVICFDPLGTVDIAPGATVDRWTTVDAAADDEILDPDDLDPDEDSPRSPGRHRKVLSGLPVTPSNASRFAPMRHEDDEDDDEDDVHDDDQDLEHDHDDEHHHRRMSRVAETLGRLSFRASSASAMSARKSKKYAVDWQRDRDFINCQLCQRPFSKLSRRRHHCRICGELICAECSPEQAHIVGRFRRPKRACRVCFAVLEAMLLAGDRRVILFRQTGAHAWTNVTPDKHLADDQDQPYQHDALHEVQRVATAGASARHAEQTRRRLCVISAAWLRRWLKFTRAAESEQEQRRRNNGRRSTNAEFVASPGPIDNLPLLEMHQGTLVRRPNLVPCDSRRGLAGEQGDYQLIPVPVWEVLYRFYGGGPRIDAIARHRNEGVQWIVDAQSILSLAAPPAAALTEPRGGDDIKLVRMLQARQDPHRLLEYANANANPSSNRSDSNGNGNGMPPMAPLRMTRSVSNDPPQPRAVSPQHSGFSAIESSAPRSPARHVAPEPEIEPMCAPRVMTPREPDHNAARAASAFAMAMKQARLNAQKSIPVNAQRRR